jgi:ribosomal protein L40E
MNACIDFSGKTCYTKSKPLKKGYRYGIRRMLFMNEVNPGAQPQANAGAVPTMERTKFCKHCGQKIPEDAVICTQCGRQVEELRQAAPVQAQPQIIINNDNTNTNTNTNNNYGAVPRGREKNKWVALLLCLFLGGIGAHKFYEGKIVMGIIYLFTAGLFGIGVLVDFISLLFKKNPYYV